MCLVAVSCGLGGFCGGGAFSSGWFWFVDDFLVGSDVVGLFWICLGFGVFFFFSFGFCGRRWFSVVVVVSGMGWICNGGCYGFLDL